MKNITALTLVASLFLWGCSSNDDDDPINVIGDTVTVTNTFQDTGITGGVQTIFGLDTAVELPNYIGFYDIDLGSNTLTMELVDNSQAADLVLPEGRFDRYYVGFGSNTIESVSLDGTAELNEFATVSILPAGFSVDIDDQFATSIAMPINYKNGGILIELGAGTDLTELNRMVTLSFN
jgi:hypothetical protein